LHAIFHVDFAPSTNCSPQFLTERAKVRWN
jgi:hypothetical protein